MAVFRYLYTRFWQDEKILELPPIEKLIFANILLSGRAMQCGISSYSKRLMMLEAGVDVKTLEKSLEKLVECQLIELCEETNEILVVNWLKYNFSDSKNTIKCIIKELKNVKNKEFLRKQYEKCLELGYPVEQIFEGLSVEYDQMENMKGLPRGLQGPCKGLEKKEIKEKINEEMIKEKEDDEEKNTMVSSASNIITYYTNNIHKPSDLEVQKLKHFLDSYPEDVVILAVDEAVLYNKPGIRYVETVLENWKRSGLKNKEDVEQHLEKWRARKCKDKQDSGETPYDSLF